MAKDIFHLVLYQYDPWLPVLAADFGLPGANWGPFDGLPVEADEFIVPEPGMKKEIKRFCLASGKVLDDSFDLIRGQIPGRGYGFGEKMGFPTGLKRVPLYHPLDDGPPKGRRKRPEAHSDRVGCQTITNERVAPRRDYLCIHKAERLIPIPRGEVSDGRGVEVLESVGGLRFF